MQKREYAGKEDISDKNDIIEGYHDGKICMRLLMLASY